MKNRLRVDLLTENPPQTHSTIAVPYSGTDEIKLVITVAPQYDICPQGRTYPMNAVPIKTSRIMIPLAQVRLFL